MSQIKPLALALHFALLGSMSLAVSSNVYAQENIQKYDIGAGTLSSVLSQFSQQSNISMVLDTETVRGLNSQGLHGAYSVDQGFAELLKETRYGVAKTANGYILVEKSNKRNHQNHADAQHHPVDHSAAQDNTITQMPTMVVTASGFSEDIKKAASTMTVVTNQEIEKKAYFSVTDALRDVPGVYITSGAGTGDEEITMRGMSSDYVLILVDGKKVNTSETTPSERIGGFAKNWLPSIEAVDHIEVIRGPASALYGSEAIGGVINIITKKTTNNWHGSIKVDSMIQEHRDKGDQYQTSANISGPIIKDVLSIKADGSFQKRSADDDTSTGMGETKLKNGHVDLTWTPNTNNTFDFDVSRTLQDRLNAGTERDYSRTNYSITHKGSYGAVETNSYVQVEDNRNSANNITGQNTTFNTTAKLPLWDKNTLSVGGMYLNEEVKSSSNVIKTASGETAASMLRRYSWALFAEDRWTVVEPFDVVTSLRLDENQKYGSNYSPKLYGVWTINPEWILKGGVSTGYKTPTLRKSSANWADTAGSGQRDGISVGNPDLKPEESTNYELSLNWDHDNLRASLTGFYSKFKNKIETVTLCEGTAGSYACDYEGQMYDFIATYYNVNSAMMAGAEATFAWDIYPNLHLTSSYTYTKSEQLDGEFKGEALNEQPKHKFSATLDYDYSDKVNTWFRVYYRGKTSEHLVTNRAFMTDGYPAYTIADTGMNFKLTSQLQMGVGIYNLFDKYVDSDNYGVTIDRRRYNLSFTYRF